MEDVTRTKYTSKAETDASDSNTIDNVDHYMAHPVQAHAAEIPDPASPTITANEPVTRTKYTSEAETDAYDSDMTEADPDAYDSDVTDYIEPVLVHAAEIPDPTSPTTTANEPRAIGEDTESETRIHNAPSPSESMADALSGSGPSTYEAFFESK